MTDCGVSRPRQALPRAASDCVYLHTAAEGYSAPLLGLTRPCTPTAAPGQDVAERLWGDKAPTGEQYVIAGLPRRPNRDLVRGHDRLVITTRTRRPDRPVHRSLGGGHAAVGPDLGPRLRQRRSLKPDLKEGGRGPAESAARVQNPAGPGYVLPGAVPDDYYQRRHLSTPAAPYDHTVIQGKTRLRPDRAKPPDVTT